MTSIAFPTLGTGFLGYDPLDSAATMAQCIATFESLHPDSSVQDITIVIYNKGSEWKHIKQVCIHITSFSSFVLFSEMFLLFLEMLFIYVCNFSFHIILFLFFPEIFCP